MRKSKTVTYLNSPKRTIIVVGISCAITVFTMFATTKALGQAPENTLSDRMEALMFRYTDCVTEWAGEYVASGASPSEIAEGAHSKCQRQFQDYVESSERYFLSITPEGTPKATAIDKARSVTSDVRAMTRAHIIRLVIETRGGKQTYH